MAAKITADLKETISKHRSLVSSALILWGLSSLSSGIIGVFVNTIIVSSNREAALLLLFQPLMNILINVFNLLFGITLISLGMRVSKSL